MPPKVYETLEFDKIKQILQNEAVTTSGKDAIQALEPSTHRLTIETRQAETTEATNYLLKQHEIPLAPITDISPILQKIDIGGIVTIPELLLLADVLRVSRQLKSSFFNGSIQPDDFSILSTYFQALYTNLNVEEEIRRSVKNEEELEDRASQELYKIRKGMQELEASIKEKLNHILHASTKYLQDAVITFRNDRFVIPVKQEFRAEVPGFVHDTSATGNTIFVEPTAVFQLNNELRELASKEQLEIERILALFTQMIAPITDAMRQGLEQISAIDFAFAKGKYSLRLQAFPPTFTEETKPQQGYLKQARHPLIPSEQVVPIDIWFGKEFHTLILTGPNTGGKTVTLKTVGLLAIMAQAGLHLPTSEGSYLPIFEHIYTDIGDEQSIEQSLSTFSSHMTNLIAMLQQVQRKDLVLIDEIGSGTDPVEGAAIAMAILEHLHQVGCLTLATTHYSELKSFAIQTPGMENASCEFDVETLRPTYQLLIGVPGKSNAFAISKKLGLPETILHRASEFLSEETIQLEDVLQDMEHNRRKAKEERELSQKLLREATQAQQAMKQQEMQLEKKKTEILQKAKQEARDLLLDAEEKANDIIKELTKIKQEKKEDANKQAEQQRLTLKKSITELQKDFFLANQEEHPSTLSPSDILVGQTVYLPKLEQEATVCTLPDKKGNVVVQAGIVKLTVPLWQLEPYQKPVTKKQVAVNSYVSSKAKDITTEIKLLGMTVDEAIPVLEKYLDDAYLSGIGMVRVVHGKGTGALRRAIHQFLKQHPHVRSYRLGVYGEGDAGVTIVEME